MCGRARGTTPLPQDGISNIHRVIMCPSYHNDAQSFEGASVRMLLTMPVIDNLSSIHVILDVVPLT